jgi:acetaldehyde dehydrogenase/alcohol dehydrogenase
MCPSLLTKALIFPLPWNAFFLPKRLTTGLYAPASRPCGEKQIAAKVKNEFIKQGGYFLDEEQVKKVGKVAVDPSTYQMNAGIVGKSVDFIAELAGISIPAGTKLLLAPLHGIGSGYPLSGEVLAPILGFFVMNSYDEVIKTCIDLNYLGGVGHTASIYANDERGSWILPGS